MCRDPIRSNSLLILGKEPTIREKQLYEQAFSDSGKKELPFNRKRPTAQLDFCVGDAV